MKVLFVTLFIVISDQITKLYVKGISIPALGINFEGMPYQSSIPVFGNYFKITFIENPGMAFGLQIGGKLFLSLFTIFATVLLFFFLYKNRKESFLLRLSLAFILGGAVGNLIDRVFYGKIYDYAPYFYGRVVDFLHFDFPNFTIFGKTIYSWPIFNIADIAVSLGFILILMGYKKIFKEEEVPEAVTDNGTFIPLSDISDQNSEYNPETLQTNIINKDNPGSDHNPVSETTHNDITSEINTEPEIIKHIDRFDIPVQAVLPDPTDMKDDSDETDMPNLTDLTVGSDSGKNTDTQNITRDDTEKKAD
ncbi:MAG TPA: signal peptidase II [Ignavibacteria bacterium]|nr:signal peptidase II [Ignavibacteria bacterium]